MELFIPSVLILLLAAAVIFFVLPRFGAPVLALISVALLVFGIYQHMNAFGTEYRLSTWQLGLVNYAPYVMVGGLLVVIAFYLLTVSPFGRPANGTTAPEIPTVAEMPNAGTATNMVTAGVNNALKGVSNLAGNAAAAVGIGNAVNKAANNKAANNKGLLGNAATGLSNAVTGVANAITGNTGAKNANNKGGNKGFRIPGLNFPLSQV